MVLRRTDYGGRSGRLRGPLGLPLLFGQVCTGHCQQLLSFGSDGLQVPLAVTIVERMKNETCMSCGIVKIQLECGKKCSQLTFGGASFSTIRFMVALCRTYVLERMMGFGLGIGRIYFDRACS